MAGQPAKALLFQATEPVLYFPTALYGTTKDILNVPRFGRKWLY